MEKIQMETGIAIIVKYYGPTNTKGSRVRLTLPRWTKNGKPTTKWISYDYEQGNAFHTAQAWLEGKGVPVMGRMDIGRKDIAMVDYEHVDRVLDVMGVIK